MGKIVMGTSISPRNIEKQLISIESWIESGFTVVSFNCEEEIQTLRPYFEKVGVNFVRIKRDAEAVSGKKLPYIEDILKEVSERSEHICGYFNSDIFLKNVTSKMYEFIYEEAKHGLIFTRRNEVSDYADVEKMDWTIHFDGLDLFWVDRNLVKDLFADGFYVQTTWSACFLEKCRIKGIHTKELVNPIAFHKRHSIQWSFEINNKLAEDFWYRYYKVRKGAFEKALNQYYSNLLSLTEKICFGGNGNEKFLFIMNDADEATVRCIQMQQNVSVEIKTDIVKQEGFDYTVYVKGKVRFEKVFCKLAIYLMEQYGLSKLNMGRFFVSEIDGICMYNNLNRNMSVVEKINELAQAYTIVLKDSQKKSKNARVFLPVLYERIDLENDIVVCVRPAGTAYLMPAGVRASEWYEINKERLKNIDIKGFLDNDLKKEGKILAGKSIWSPDILTKAKKGSWVIVASKYYSREIETQLLEIVEKERILDIGYILKVDDTGIFYCFNLKRYKKQYL